jgi:hypothetical protein
MPKNDSLGSELIFGGVVTSGIGRHAELLVPGRGEVPAAPSDWPEKLWPGSLNVRVDRYPTELKTREFDASVVVLDTRQFAPAFEIERGQFKNNFLAPRPGVPRGGDAQAWRAKILVDDTGASIGCWALRRFGSRVGEQLEFVADRRLRDEGLLDGQRVRAVLFGKWRDT